MVWQAEKGGYKCLSRVRKKRIDKGQRPELVGGGLIRSKGGWSQVESLSGLAQPKNKFQAQGCFEKPGGKFVLQAIRI